MKEETCIRIYIIAQAFVTRCQKVFLLSVDFEKAYSTITFEHTLVIFQSMALPMGILSLVTEVLQAPVAFCIQVVVVPEVVWTPGAGVRQGDRFSPTLFVLLGSVIIPVLQKVDQDLHVRMYAENWVIYIAPRRGRLLSSRTHLLPPRQSYGRGPGSGALAMALRHVCKSTRKLHQNLGHAHSVSKTSVAGSSIEGCVDVPLQGTEPNY